MFHKKTLMEYSEINRSRSSSVISAISQAGWALSNIICLVTATANNSTNFTDYVDLVSYVEVINILAEEFEVDLRLCADSCLLFDGENLTFGSLRYMDLLKPVTMQWHLASLMASVKRGSSDLTDPLSTTSGKRSLVGLELCDVARFYSHMIRIYSMLNTTVGSLPVLNILSFTPGFLLNIWDRLEKLVFPANSQASKGSICIDLVSQKRNDGAFDKKPKQFVKDGGAKWITMLQRITAKRKSDPDHVEFVSKQVSGLDDEDIIDSWDVEPMRSASASISKDTSFLLHLFCATYVHLLLVLDDIEFYERQVPFTLEQQRRIASMLNTLVYNGMLHSNGQLDKFLMDAAVKCLQMLYERDCRHQFCPPSLWLAPARVSRPPIAAAARLHLAARPDDYSPTTSVGSFITTTPHVYPFEERVQIFREFIKMDKVSRKMAGELTGPSEQSTEVVVRRGHIVEDGFRQLNSLGSKLKSSIHVSFIGECGLPEAGLDYGGLSKEFLTDIAKEAFSPNYGLFTQTVTTERLLIPNTAAIFRDNGIQMIEFLGRIVGKSLYEGLLLDYSFSRAFVQKLLGRYSFLDELSTLDPELYKNLIYLKHYDGDIEELSLDFTVTEESLGKLHVIELKPGGKDTSVTDENKLQYIHAMADYKLNRQILPLSNAFYRGLTDLISPSWLGLFNANEFNQLLSGGNHDFDVDDLRDNTQYTGGYAEGSRTVKLFWEVLSGLEPKERCMLLKFVTSCSRAPLLGFKYLQPIFTIHKVAYDTPLWAAIGGHDVERLPSASTCYNTLKLPTYKRASTLKAKLLYAINSNAGFELS